MLIGQFNRLDLALRRRVRAVWPGKLPPDGPGGGQDMEPLIRHAGRALYQAKNDGRDTCAFYRTISQEESEPLAEGVATSEVSR